MKIALTAFTPRGVRLARVLKRLLSAEGDDCALHLGKKLDPAGYDSVTAWAGKRFADMDALVFVGACGIAVRAVAPHLRDKFTDPAVVSIDEEGRVAVPLAGGHVGGANRLAKRIAVLAGGIAAVSTATDINGLPAIDVWAADRGFAITDRALAKEVSAALLRGEPVGFRSDFPMDRPQGLTEGPADLGVWVTAHSGEGPFPKTLRLVPKYLTLGIGCRKGASEEAIHAAVERALAGWDLRAVRAVCTIDRKQDEPGLLAFCQSLGVPLTAYTADQLRAVPGNFASSDFVAETVGVDNVCERAAALSGGTLILRKQVQNGVTVAAALDEVIV